MAERASSSEPHRWAAVVITSLNDEEAARLGAMPTLARLDAVRELVNPAGGLVDVTAVRGPICSECRVSYEEVAAIERSGKEWPCPGRRPKALGGRLVPDERRPTRQEIRDKQRKAVKQSAQAKAVRRAAAAAIDRRKAASTDHPSDVEETSVHSAQT